MITPFDKSAMRDIEKAIRDSDLGVNPSNDGNIIRVTFPELTEDRRKEYIKVAQDQGRGRQDLDPQRPPQGQGDPRQARQGRRGRRGRGPPRREGARRHHREVRRHRSTSCSSTRKPSCSRSEEFRERLFLGSADRSRATGGRPTRGPPRGLPRRVPRTNSMRLRRLGPCPSCPKCPTVPAGGRDQDDDRGAARPSGPLFRDESPGGSRHDGPSRRGGTNRSIRQRTNRSRHSIRHTARRSTRRRM